MKKEPLALLSPAESEALSAVSRAVRRLPELRGETLARACERLAECIREVRDRLAVSLDPGTEDPRD